MDLRLFVKRNQYSKSLRDFSASCAGINVMSDLMGKPQVMGENVMKRLKLVAEL